MTWIHLAEASDAKAVPVQSRARRVRGRSARLLRDGAGVDTGQRVRDGDANTSADRGLRASAHGVVEVDFASRQQPATVRAVVPMIDVVAGGEEADLAVEGEGHGGLFDARWSPCGLFIAATDSHGHLSHFGVSGNDQFRRVRV